MAKMVTLGRTGITVNFNAFGALPIQRVSDDIAVHLLRKAYAGGMRYFDTARVYSDSEHKMGLALADVRADIFIATKTFSTTTEGFWKDLQTSLTNLKTDYIDVYQFHNPAFCPKPGDGSGLYEAMLEAKAQGKIRHIALTNHRLPVATEAVENGLYDLIQFPFCYLADARDEALVRLCAEKNVGFVCMKALSGGLIMNGTAAAAYLAQFNVLPIWGVQNDAELDEFLALMDAPPTMTDEIAALIAADRAALTGNFCRACGYCLPCPAQIDIPTSARMSLLLRRAPAAGFLTPEWQEKMSRINNCIDCNHCESHCPYGIPTKQLLRQNLEDYRTFIN